ncbi:hypothetical protein FRC05_001222 [Tulasnella sp. 425]|nr:hypothetical protein FRC05_001222 [Tulasnella sp. 425]
MSSSTYPRNPPIQVTAPTTDWAPNGRALSPPPASPRSPARLNFTAATTSSNNGSKGASWLFNQLNTRPKISNGIEHQVQQQNGGLKPPVIDEADEREPGAEPSNASVLSFSSSVEVMSEGGLRRNGTVRSADHIHSRASDDGFVRVNKPPIPGSMRKSDTMPRPRTSDTVDRLKEASSSNIPLTSLYLVSGLPKNPATWTLADADSVVGVHHSEGAVGRWWRAEVLGSTITPGVGGGKDKKKKRATKSRAGETAETKAGLGKGDLGKMLSKSLKLSFPREVEIIASTLQPASTIHSFTFSVPTTRDLTAPASASQLRASVFSTTTAASGTVGDRNSYLGHPGMSHGMHLGIPGGSHIGLAPPELDVNSTDPNNPPKETMYHGVCLTVWSHADEERTAAIRRTLETAAYARSRTHKVSMSSMATSIAPSVATSTGRSANGTANRPRKRSMPWSGTEMDESETDAGAMTESEADFSGNADGAGASTLFLPQNTVFWLPYALTLVSRHPIYDLMRDYLTLSWARFSKDVQSHTLQIAKILEAPSPRAGDIVRLDAGASGEHLEVVCRFPGGLDFGRGLVDVNFTMWPIFRCLNLDNILTLCEIALAPTGRVLFISRHPAMLGLAVSTLKYLCELRGWNGVAHHNVHSRDAKIYLEDPGPWIIAMSTESRYCVRPSPEVCVCDLDINYVNCPSPPPGAISVKLQREKFRKILMGAFDQYFHPDHGVPSEFKEAFPAGRFRPLCKITSKRGSSVVAESIKAPEWWHQTRVVTAFDTVLKEKAKKPSFIKRISTLGLMNKRPAQLSPAERLIQASIRKRATAFVDARDDLETKIGRLSRRLNFLMTESELWRQKFVAFEGYAEKLSAEAGELRSKINKEQRESKRLSGLVGIAAHEKHMLQQRLVDTESKHKQAMVELERMKVEMEEMEEEREKMVQDVEAQIERALASMTLSDHYESDSQSSNFSMRSTGRIGAGRSRPGSANSHRPGTRGLRSFATSSTLAVNAMADEDMERIGEGQDDTMVIEEEEGSGEGATARKASTADLKQKKRRFSASSQEPHLDGLNAVDVGISQRIDTVAEKMMAIQAKLENAFEHSRKTRSRAATPRSQMDSGDEEYMGSRPSSRNRPGRFYRSETPPQRSRTYSTQSQGERDAIIARRTASSSGLRNVAVPPVPPLPSQSGLAPQPTLQRMPSGVSLSATRPMTPPEERPRPQQNNSSGSSKPTGYPVRGGTPAVTDDSGDDSYMSAYSYSPPRTEQALHGDDDDEPLDVLDVHHETSNTSVAEALLEDHDITREFGKGRSPLLMARNRSLSNVTTSTARGSYEQQQAATPKSSAVAAVSVPVETASPTVSDYSTQSSTTTRLTSVADSTEC